MLVKVRRWQHSAGAEGRWGSLTKCGVSKLVMVRRRTVLQVRHEVQRSNPSTHIPRVEVFWNEVPRRTVVPMEVLILVVEGNEESKRKICDVWDDEGHDGPS